jgi:hypothetical protein
MTKSLASRITWYIFYLGVFAVALQSMWGYTHGHTQNFANTLVSLGVMLTIMSLGAAIDAGLTRLLPHFWRIHNQDQYARSRRFGQHTQMRSRLVAISLPVCLVVASIFLAFGPFRTWRPEYAAIQFMVAAIVMMSAIWMASLGLPKRYTAQHLRT